MRVGELRLMVHDPSQAEVTDLHVALSVQEDVAGLQVPMQDLLWQLTSALVLLPIVDLAWLLPAVALEEPQRDLSQDFPNDVFRDVVLLLTCASDDHSQVSAIAALHDDVDLLRAFVDDAVVVLHDVRVGQVSQDVHL